MSGVIICFSYGGTSLKYAESLHQQCGHTLIEIKEHDKRSKFNAYVHGTMQARAHKKVELMHPIPDLSGFDRILMVFPVWGGYPAPAFNSVVSKLPAGKEVSLHLISKSGSTSEKAKREITDLIKCKDCHVNKIFDVSSASVNR